LLSFLLSEVDVIDFPGHRSLLSLGSGGSLPQGHYVTKLNG
jgi:hypothetical protein